MLSELESNELNPAIMNELESGKNLNTNLDKVLIRKKLKLDKFAQQTLNAPQPTSDDSQSALSEEDPPHAPDRDLTHQSDVIGQTPGVNLFAQKSFTTDRKLSDFVDLKPQPAPTLDAALNPELVYDAAFMVLNPFKGALNEALTTRYLTKSESIGEKDTDLIEFILVEDSILQQINSITPPQIQTHKKNYNRPPLISLDRLNLPIMSKEIDLIDSIRNSLVTIVCGTTGSGKSTQLPQMLLESGFSEYGLIGVTQPRRLAAIALGERVAVEIGEGSVGRSVGYQVRFESSRLGKGMGLKFMTDGILLNEMMSNFLL